MLWWMLLRSEKKREPIGMVVDLCATCQATRLFRVVRIWSGSAVSGAKNYLNDEKWCSTCGVGSHCNPMRYGRPLFEAEVMRGSEQQALEATNPMLAAKLSFLDRCEREAAQAERSQELAAVRELATAVKQLEAQGHDTSELLRPLNLGGPPNCAQLLAVVDQLRATEAQRARNAAAMAETQKRERRVRWQAYGLAVLAGVVAGLFAWVPVAQPPWLVIGAATMMAAAGAFVGAVVLDAKMADRLVSMMPALLVAAVMSTIAWFSHTRGLQVDNPTGDAITVFINDRSEPLKPGDQRKLYIAKSDSYKLGWALPGEDAPTQWLETTIEDDAIYNPGSSACYWLGIDVYSVSGTATVSDDEPWGPQPIRELYMFDKIDNWFEYNPDEVELPNHSSSAKRYALLYDNDCMRFIGCDIEVRQKLQSCRARALRQQSESAHQTCIQKAEQRCPDAAPSDSAPQAGSSGPSK